VFGLMLFWIRVRKNVQKVLVFHF